MQPAGRGKDPNWEGFTPVSMPFRLLVPQNLYDATVAQALAEQPFECCGLLAGKLVPADDPAQPAVPVGRVVERYPLVNAAASARRYHAEEHSLLAAHRDIFQRGLD